MKTDRKSQVLQSIGQQLAVVAAEREQDQGSMEYVDLGLLHVDLSQPRRYFNPEKQEQLNASVKKRGILVPLLVRPIPQGGYEVVAGERRYRAAKAAKLKTVPVRVREMSNLEAKEVALLDNLQREDLNPYEETEASLEALALHLKASAQEVVSLLHQMKNGRGRGEVAVRHNAVPNPQVELVEAFFSQLGRMDWYSFTQHRLPLLNLPEDVKDCLRRGQLEYTKAKAIARVKDGKTRGQLLKQAMDDDLPLKAITALIQQTLAPTRSKSSGTSPTTGGVQQQAARLLRQLPKAQLSGTSERKVAQLLNELEKLLGGEA